MGDIVRAVCDVCKQEHKYDREADREADGGVSCKGCGDKGTLWLVHEGIDD